MDSISSLALSSGRSILLLELESERTETTSSELGSEECIEFRGSGSEWSLNRNLGADEDSICILAMIFLVLMKSEERNSLYGFLKVLFLGCFIRHGYFR